MKVELDILPVGTRGRVSDPSSSDDVEIVVTNIDIAYGYWGWKPGDPPSIRYCVEVVEREKRGLPRLHRHWRDREEITT